MASFGLLRSRKMRIVATAGVKALVLSGSALLNWLIIHAFGAGQLGLFSVGMSAALLVGIVFRGGMPQLMARTAVEHPDAGSDNLFFLYLREMFKPSALMAVSFALAAGISVFLYGKQGMNAAIIFGALIPTILLMAIAQLAGVTAKISGRVIVASVLDMGLVYIAIFLWLGFVFLAIPEADLRGGLLAFCAVQVAFLFFLAWHWRGRIVNDGDGKVVITSAQRRHVGLNAIILLFLRNGYPLVFLYFVALDDIGRFRLEERYAYVLTFIFAVMETVFARPMIQKLKNGGASRSHMMKSYGKLLSVIVFSTLVLSALCYFLIQIPFVFKFLGFTAPAIWTTGVLFFAAPLLAFLSTNNMLLNMMGKFSGISISIGATVTLFLALSLGLYPAYGGDGLKMGYIIGLCIGCAFSGLYVLRAIRTLPLSIGPSTSAHGNGLSQQGPDNV